MIKANTQINEDHIRLMELILPYGVKVKGFLHYGVDSSIDEDEILRSIRISFGGNRYLISEELYVIERLHGKENMFDNSSFRYIKYNPILGVIQTLDKPKPSIKFIDINSKIKEEFVYFQSSINIITLANINSYIQNELFHSDVGLYLPDYNILIYDNLNDEEWNELALNNQRKLEKLQSKEFKSDIGYTLLFNSDIKDDTYFEETNNTFYSICQEIPDLQKIKSIKISFSLFMNKKDLKLKIIYEKILNFSKFISDVLDNKNSSKSLTYSLFTHRDSKKCPIPFGVLYSYEDTYDPYEETIQDQKNFLIETLCLTDANKNNLTKYVLEDKFNEDFTTVLNSEAVEIKVSNIRNVHELFSQLPFELGSDYYYYHVGMNNELDRCWSIGYRALQTLLSWFILNGHGNSEVPRLSELTKCLPYLGQVKSSKYDTTSYCLSLTDIGMMFSYIIDSQVEIISFDDIIQYNQNKHLIKSHFEVKKSPMILYIHPEDKILTVLGMDKNGLNNIYVLDHSYNGKSNVFNLKRGKVFYEVSLVELFKNNEKIEFLLIK